MPNASPLLLLAILCGAFIPVHAGMNAGLGRAVGHPIWATILSLGVSFTCLAVLVVLLRPDTPSWSAISATPIWASLGGLIGVIYVIAGMTLAPRLGAATFIATVVAGQMAMALVLDHYGLLGFPRRPVEMSRVFGAAIVIGGVLTMQINRAG